MTRNSLVRNLLLAVLTAGVLQTLPARAQDYTDIWYNRGESGWGVNVVQADSFLFLTFFIYGPDKKPTWYTGQVTWDGSKYTGGLYLTQGSWYAGQWNPADSPPAQQVGTVTFQPSSVNAHEATLTYTVNGVGTVVKPIERQTLTTIALGGNYVGGQSGSWSSCANPGDNGPYNDSYKLSVGTTIANFATLAFRYDSATTCTLSGTLEQHGQLYQIPSARYQCTGNLPNGTAATVYELKQTAQGIEGRLAATLSNGCQESAAFSATMQF